MSTANTRTYWVPGSGARQCAGAPHGAPGWRRVASVVLAALLLGACSDPEPLRWYTDEQVQIGEGVFQAECAVCHGAQAQGSDDWRQRDEAGHMPPPPLDGTAHAWHHPLHELRMVIHDGWNNMPAFGERLDEAEIDAVIAWFQSQWSDAIHEAWLEYDEHGQAGHGPADGSDD